MWFSTGIFLNNLLIICNTYFSTQVSNLLSFSGYVPPQISFSISPLVLVVCLVSKSFDFIACEKDVLWLLLSLTNAELRHILRFSVCKFKFYVRVYSDIQNENIQSFISSVWRVCLFVYSEGKSENDACFCTTNTRRLITAATS